ncbi:MAG: sulfurtransferase TusA family protein [Syntrophus sp. (in: bacteria)]|nr:sulfurtransferase TusA family protein [Syntrophus sp. (in: bacteria)]
MAKTVDARGLSCPQPVLMTLDEIKGGSADELLVMVDNEASKENVSRAAKSQGWKIADIHEAEGVFNITLRKE